MHRNKLRGLLAALAGITLYLVLLLILGIPDRITRGNHAQLAIQQLDRMRPPMIRIQRLKGATAPSPELQRLDEAAADLREQIAHYQALARYDTQLIALTEQFAAASETWLADEQASWQRRAELEGETAGMIVVKEIQRLHQQAVASFLIALEVLARGEQPMHADIEAGRLASQSFRFLTAGLVLFLLTLLFLYQRASQRELQAAYSKLQATRRQLAEREEYLSRTLDSIGDAVITTNTEGRITRMNPVAERLTGWTADEALGKPLTEVFRIRNTHTREEVENPVNKVLQNGNIVGLANHTVLLSRNGDEFQIADSGAPICDNNGEILGVILVFRDVTDEYRLQEQIRLHRDELEARVAERTADLEQSNRELESFSYAVSHDLRAPLRAINGFSQILLDDNLAQLDATGQDYLRRVAAAARYMGELIDAMLVLSRVSRQEIRRQPVDLSQYAREIAEEFQQQDPERKVEWCITEGVEVEGDPELLRVVLVNLLGNAWKYSRDRRNDCRIEFGIIERDGLRTCYVRDNGCGFDPTYADKLFTAFQRLHGREYEGTGVGLATVFRIIRRHHGEIYGESQPGKGATFYFTLANARNGG